MMNEYYLSACGKGVDCDGREFNSYLIGDQDEKHCVSSGRTQRYALPCMREEIKILNN